MKRAPTPQPTFAPNHILTIEQRSPTELRGYGGHTRISSARQQAALKASISKFGFVVPALIKGDGELITGHARVSAARALGLKSVPVIQIDHLNDAEIRAFRLTDNRLTEHSKWDTKKLNAELLSLQALDLDFSLEITGWDHAELDVIMQPLVVAEGDPADEDCEPEEVPVTRLGDVWQLGRHRLICGSSLEAAVWDQVMDGAVADVVFTDPPYNVPVDGHVSGLGKVKHREFEMAAGEMSEAQFTTFLVEALGQQSRVAREGAIIFACMDWRHMHELESARRALKFSLLNICVWNKTNGGMGSLYRSKHELVSVWKKGKTAHVNNVQLGKHGRYRTNVWDFAGVNSFGKDRASDLDSHPTVKPIALVAEAIRDVSNRGDIVIDGFMGSGTTLMAAERTGRTAYGVELDPLYVDVAIRRWMAATGGKAQLAQTGQSFDEVEQEREDEHDPLEDAASPVSEAPRIRHRAPPLAA